MSTKNEPDSWRYAIVAAKFTMNLLEVSISKSFGVLIPDMASIFQASYSVIGLVCSLPVTFMFLSCPVIGIVMKNDRVSPRVVAMIGGFVSSFSLIASGFTRNVAVLGFCLSANGIGLALGFLPCGILLNEYFPEHFVTVNSFSNLGSTLGALVVPLIIERCLRAYGYSGAMLILGGICLHSLVASAILKRPRNGNIVKAAEIEMGEIDMSMDDNNEITGKVERDTLDDNCRMNAFQHPEKRKKSNTRVNEEKETLINKVTGKVGKGTFKMSKAESEETSRTWTENLSVWLCNCIFIKEPLYTFTLPVQFLIQVCTYSWILFLVPHAEWLGIESYRAVLMSTIGGAGGLAGRLFVTGILYLKFNPIILCCLGAAICSLSFLLDPVIHGFAALGVTAFVQGWCVFLCGNLVVAFTKRNVSHSNFPIAYGFACLVNGIGGVVGGLLSGFIFDHTQSYTVVFMTVGGIYFCVVIHILIYLAIIYRKRLRSIFT